MTRDKDIIEVEITESGGIRLFSGRLSDELKSSEQGVIFDVMAVALTRQLCLMAAHVAGTTGYRGQWVLGVAAVGVEGMPAYDGGGSFFGPRLQAYALGQGDYRQVVLATTEELEQASGRLTGRLIGRFLRALGRGGETHAALLQDEGGAA